MDESIIGKAFVVISAASIVLGIWAVAYYRTSTLGIHSWEVCRSKYGLVKDSGDLCRTPDGRIFEDQGKYSLS